LDRPRPCHSYCSSDLAPRFHHSFPTRRSSDLLSPPERGLARQSAVSARRLERRRAGEDADLLHHGSRPGDGGNRRARDAVGCRRSEEHTSELQSRENLVCRLLLEKKKKHTNAV